MGKANKKEGGVRFRTSSRSGSATSSKPWKKTLKKGKKGREKKKGGVNGINAQR